MFVGLDSSRSYLKSIAVLAVLLAGPAYSQQIESGSVEGSDTAISKPEKIFVTEDGKKVFTGNSYEEFYSRLKEDLDTLKKTDYSAYLSVMKGMTQTIVFKGFNFNPADLNKGVPQIDFSQKISVDSEEFFLDYYNSVSDRISEGVTFESIAKMGKAYRDNAVVTYENSVISITPELDRRFVALKEKRKEVESILGRFSIITPEVYEVGGTYVFSARGINDVGMSISGVTIIVSSLPDEGELVEQRMEVKFERPVGDGQLVTFEKDLPEGFSADQVGRSQVIAKVVKVTAEDGWEVTGDEFDEAMVELEAVQDELLQFKRRVSYIISEEINKAVFSK